MCSSPVPQRIASWISGASSSQAVSSIDPVSRPNRRSTSVGHAAVDVPPPAAHVAPTSDQLDAALLKRLGRVGDQQRGVEGVDLPQAVALRAHALRAVEAEQLRAGRLEAQIAVGAGVMGRKLNVACGRGDPFAGRRRRRRIVGGLAGHGSDREIAVAHASTPAPPPRPVAGGSSDRPRAGRRPPRCCAASGGPAADSSVRRTTAPSTRARTKPCFSRSSNRSRYSPFCRESAAPGRENASRRAGPRSARGSARGSGP